MSPEQIAIISAIATIINNFGTWPISVVIGMIVFGPWILQLFLSRAQEKRVSAMKEMYENNIKLVEGYEKLSGEQQELIIMTTQAMTEVKNLVKHFINSFHHSK